MRSFQFINKVWQEQDCDGISTKNLTEDELLDFGKLGKPGTVNRASLDEPHVRLRWVHRAVVFSSH